MVGRSRALLAALAPILLCGLPLPAAGEADPLHASFTVSRYAPNTAWAGPVDTVRVMPGDDSELAAAAAGTGGVFTSSDGGRSWSHEDGLISGQIKSLAWVTLADGGGAGCPCLLAAAAPDFEASSGGGLYEANHFDLRSHRWGSVPGIFPAGPGCSPVTRRANDIAISPDAPRMIYVATDCGLAIGAATSTGLRFNAALVPGSSQEFDSVVALPGGRVIIGGPAGVRFYDGTRWSTSAGLPRDAHGLSTPHALAMDPRPGGNRAYVMTQGPTAPELFETRDGGANWHQIAISLADDAGMNASGCGGIPNVHAVERGGALHLYAGDTCHTFEATIPQSGINPEPDNPAVVNTSSWSTLDPDGGSISPSDPAGHSDTWDLAFHSRSNLPYALASDGGLDLSSDGRSFHPASPAQGLTDSQVTEITGQFPSVPPGTTTPDLYFATWHDWLWSMVGTSTTPAGAIYWEGFALGMPTRPTAGSENKITLAACDGCHNDISSPRFPTETPPLWNDAERGVSQPTFVAPQQYVQAVDSMNTRTHAAGLQMTRDDGNTWHQILTTADGRLANLPSVVGPASSPTLDGVYLYTDPSSMATSLRLYAVHNLDPAGGESSASPTCASSLHNCMIRPAMRGFGSFGVTPANTPSYVSYAVDPNDPNRMFAPDVQDGQIKRSDTEGGDWNAIPGLPRQISHDGLYRSSVPWGNGGRLIPNASVVSICPYDSSRMLIGTHQGGAFFSYDSGDTWIPVTGSEQVRYATSVFWLPGCASAFIATFGDGIFEIQISLTAELPSNSCAPPVCRLRKLIRNPHPWPSAVRGLVVTDGYIKSVASRPGKAPVVTVTSGAVVVRYRGFPKGVRVAFSRSFGQPGHGVIRAVFFLHGRVFRTFRDTRRLQLFPHPYGHEANAPRGTPPAPAATLEVTGDVKLDGNAYTQVDPRRPLRVHGTVAHPGKPIRLELDGQAVASYPAGTKHFDFTGKVPYAAFPPPRAFGMHTFTLVTSGQRHPLASSIFFVPNGDTPDEEQRAKGTPTHLSVSCPTIVTQNDSLTIRGRLAPGFAGALVTVTYTEPGGGVVDKVLTDDQGAFSDSIPAGVAGTWTVGAAFDGDPIYQASNAAPCSLQVVSAPPLQTPTSLSLVCPSGATLKGSLDVSGSLSPPFAGAAITLTYTSPNGSIVRETTTDLQGNFADSVEASVTGAWSVAATFPGDASHGSSAATCTTTVS